MLTVRQRADRVLAWLAQAVPPLLEERLRPLVGIVLREERPMLLRVLEERIREADTAEAAQVLVSTDRAPAFEDTARRAELNLKAMGLLSKVRWGTKYEAVDLDALSPERGLLALYSGWGGVGIQRYANRFPAGFPVPEARGLIHEYYTPLKVWSAVASALKPFQATLLDGKSQLRALEPSAGIGRALRAFEGWPAAWTAIEYSNVSSMLLRAVFPSAEVFSGPFERWVAENPGRAAFDLIVSNPPYGPRGAAAELDPDQGYKTTRAAMYFLRRGLDMLRPGGWGVYLIPTGFLTGTSVEYQRYREAVLKRHHLATAYRLPSVPPAGGTLDDVVYEQMPTDLLFFQARGGTLPAVGEEDRQILEGSYFHVYPDGILGVPEGELADEDAAAGKPKARRGYQVRGVFRGLPPLNPRPMVGVAAATASRTLKDRGGIAREIREAGPVAADVDAAVRLGMRADRFLAGVARQDATAALGWQELHADLLAWNTRHGDPLGHKALLALAGKRITGAERFLACWERGGRLIGGLRTPPKIEAAYQGAFEPLAVADWLFRAQGGRLSVANLEGWWAEHTGGDLPERVVPDLVAAGWCLDGEHWDDLEPARVYFTGFLWPKYDRAMARAAQGDVSAGAQADKLRERIGFRPGVMVLKDTLPIDSWLPLDLVSAWAREHVGLRGEVLERKDGLLAIEDEVYANLQNTEKGRSGHAQDFLSFLGWANQDRNLWKPEREKVADPETGQEKLEPVDLARRKQVDDWLKAWAEWMEANPARMDQLETAYNRALRGYVVPELDPSPLTLSRWNNEAVQLQPHQVSAARRLVTDHRGLLGFDVGVGKTYTGLATLARARQEGWARRPVVLVPNSIIWKWYRDFERVLPDYRVCVIGSKRKLATSGPRKGKMIAETDTPVERAEKWTRFQGGEYDAVLLTYSALGRQKMNPEFIAEYVGKTVALRRAIAMSLARAEEGGGEDEDEDAPKRAKFEKVPTERETAVREERARAWIGRMMLPPKGWDFDPGIDWHDLGIDFLMVDEAQNFKNLLHSDRGGQAKGDTARAWALDFRAASVRSHAGGGGIFLLSATISKNAPEEYYTAIHYLGPDLWNQVGITNHEEFLTRFGDYQMKEVPDAGGRKWKLRPILVGWKNLEELQAVLTRWGIFKTAEEVGLKLPEVERKSHVVQATPAMLDALGSLYSEMADLEEDIKKAMRTADSAAGNARVQKLLQRKMGLALRIYLSYIHPSLPGMTGDARSAAAVDPHEGPKLTRCVTEILNESSKACAADGSWCLDCGHIIFCDNIAVHYWMRDLLVEAGISRERIAILNAVEAKDTELRQQIVLGFNGIGSPEDEEYTPPRYDIVIANAVAYEGMDLQVRTCAIHHLDVPWEPATLQQRNGRGVRQGNKFGIVRLHYYAVEGSNEIHRIHRIESKRTWQASVISGSARSTNTTMETDAIDLDQLSLSHASPEDRERLIRSRRESEIQRLEDARKAARIAANRELREASALFRRIWRETDPKRTGEILGFAEAALGTALRYPASNWDRQWTGKTWHERAAMVRARELFIPASGPPLLPGEVAHLDETFYEVCALDTAPDTKRKLVRGIWLRRHNAQAPAIFMAESSTFEVGEASLGIHNSIVLGEDWPDEQLAPHTIASNYCGYPQTWGGASQAATPSIWNDRGWYRLPDSRQDLWWPHLAPRWASVSLGNAERQGTLVPFEVRGRLVLVGRDAHEVPPGAQILPPTIEGWARFLALQADYQPRTPVRIAATWWWHRTIPRSLTGEATAVEAA